LAQSGHQVLGVDVQQDKVDSINRGGSPVVEPKLEQLAERAVQLGMLRATQDAGEAIRSTEISLVCVGTPSDERGHINLSALERVCTSIGHALRRTEHFHSVVFRSTVLPGTTRSVAIPILERESGRRAGQDFGVGYNPEFMREGSAVADFFNPPFTVVAALDSETLKRLRALYESIEAPFVELDLQSAELLKSVCNAFHAMKVVFANEVGVLCDAIGVDGARLMEVFCQDTKLNLSPKYLRPGFAFGGSCLPKDLRALESLARSYDLNAPLLKGILASNEAHTRRAEDLILATGKTRIGMIGLTFKVGTDDTRESPALKITQTLIQKGCEVWAYEPDLDLDRLVGVNREYIAATFPNFTSRLVGSVQELARRADVLVITKSNGRYMELLSELHPDHLVVDLVGFFAGQSLPCPRIALC
jgi:GDP-mannose 6-dehydrogenase